MLLSEWYVIRILVIPVVMKSSKRRNICSCIKYFMQNKDNHLIKFPIKNNRAFTEVFIINELHKFYSLFAKYPGCMVYSFSLPAHIPRFKRCYSNVLIRFLKTQ